MEVAEERPEQTYRDGDAYELLKEGCHWPALEFLDEAYEFHELSKPLYEQLYRSRGYVSPEFLVQALQAHFKYYREMRQTPETKAIQGGEDEPLEKTLEKSDEAPPSTLATLSYFASRIRSAAGQASALAKSTVDSLNAMRTPKHTALTIWFEAQMQAILAQQASSRKKMTDLTILLAGLLVYLGEKRHSATLFPLCRDVYAMVWNPASGSFKKPLQSHSSDKQHFENRFRYQILAASRLVSAQFIFRGGPFYGPGGPGAQAQYSYQYQDYVRSRSVEIATYTWLTINMLPTPIEYPEANMGLQYNNYLDSLPVARIEPRQHVSEDSPFDEAPDPNAGSNFLNVFK